MSEQEIYVIGIRSIVTKHRIHRVSHEKQTPSFVFQHLGKEAQTSVFLYKLLIL
jgi:hypothetical protein